MLTEPLLTRWPFNKLRNKALQLVMKHIHYEDESSRYIVIGGVDKVINKYTIHFYIQGIHRDRSRIYRYIYIYIYTARIHSSIIYIYIWSSYICLLLNLRDSYAPSIGQPFFTLATWIEDPHGVYFKKHLHRIHDILWVGEDGMKLQVSRHIY